jgi:hypothetical protein
MSKLSEKYVAGFLDSDGTICLQCREGWKPTLYVGFSQKTSKDEVLKAIQEEFGGSIKNKKVGEGLYSQLDLCGNKAKNLLNRIAKHLVVKRHYANVCLKLSEEKVSNQKAIREELKIQRRQRSYPLPKHPTRKWLAGYFDGDGCLSVMNIRKPFGQAHIVSHIASSNYDTEGIEIIHKNFGGAIHDMKNGTCKQLVISLSNPSKAKEFLGYFGKHCIVKRDQVLFVLGCADMGHYRDGKNIKSALKQLKAQEQRLSESEVAQLVNTIRDLPKRERDDYHLFYRNAGGRIVGKGAA